ncbi:DUF4912 domain-containing protein [Leptospira sp. GIMC2001]|uniref:DUF4912 domain-containing protein n=1 Tax=Leptospira sp. GIMC2001 TaxID=1513297 RepID=UPI00234B3861|nr:DUF4912 domain-containing protein [Leptospira sp. GIMC2001]WCL50480.1 DUF4912 domain-containing protein [Leptospira sp. GIMC2001]
MTPKKKIVKSQSKKKATSQQDVSSKGKVAAKKKTAENTKSASKTKAIQSKDTVTKTTPATEKSSIPKSSDSKISKSFSVKKANEQSQSFAQDSFIYEDDHLQKPISNPNRDIIKILIRNPHEAFVFWNILPSTYARAVNFFHASEDQIGLKIDIEYLSGQGKKQSQSIQLHPLSQSYLFRFDKPVTHLSANLSAIHEGIGFHLFDCAPVSLPRDESSDVWDEDWVNPEWVRTGILIKGQDGKYRFAMASEQSEIDPVTREKLRSALEQRLGGSSPFGSSFGSSTSQGFSK